MALLRIFCLGLLLHSLHACSTASDDATEASTPRPEYVLVIHGGAGTITRDNMDPEKEAAYLKSLHAALDAGEAILQNGGTALDAIEAAIVLMEDDSLFNAGRGAVFTYEGSHELDASIMDGQTLGAGAVAGIRALKNPVLAARAVMAHSVHVFLAGKGAEEFAIEQGLEQVDPSWFHTDSRRRSLLRMQGAEGQGALPPSAHAQDSKYGTVGAVALDKHGNLAAATSTGGMTNKRWNRIGDAPVIGAGTYADNRSCAVSCTGHGEYFIRYAVAHEVAARMRHGGQSLVAATRAVLFDELLPAGGTGGLIAVDKVGNHVMDFNTSGMYRGYAKPGEREVGIYREEE
jgi:beta-aspartyl-peptidase (threonine type)